MEAREGLVYSTAEGSAEGLADFAAAAPGAVSTMYASLDALESVAGACLVRFDQPPGYRPVRCNLFLVGVATDGQTGREDLYLVTSAWLDGKSGVKLAYLGRAEYAFGTDGVSAALGGRPDHKWAKTCAFTTSGYAEAISGGVLVPRAFPSGTGGAGNPAGLCVHHIGNGVGILRVPAKGAATPATGVAPMHERWR